MVAGKSCTGIGTGPQDGDDVDVHRHSIGMRPIKNFWPEREHLDHGEDAVNMYYCSSMSRQCPMNVCTVHREHLDHGEDAVNMYHCSSMSRQCPMNVRVPACDGRDDIADRGC